MPLSYYNVAEEKDRIIQPAICKALLIQQEKQRQHPEKSIMILASKVQIRKMKYRMDREVANQWVMFSADPVLIQSICPYP